MQPSVVAMIEFAEHLGRSQTLAELERDYLRGVGRFVDMPGRGLYLLDPVSELPVHGAGENISDFFMRRYEAVGRALDPMLAVVRQEHRAIYNLEVMPEPEWVATPLYQQVAGLHGMTHVVEAPAIAEGQLLGTLNFASNRPPDDPHLCVETAQILGRLVGQAIAAIRHRDASDRLVHNVLAALDAARTPLIMSVSPDEPPRPNEVARELLDQLVGGSELVYEAVARPADRLPATRDLSVRLKNGEPRSLRIHTRSPAEDPDAVVAVLALTGGRTQLDAVLQIALSPRERQVCELLVHGRTDREIATELGLSQNTISQYVKQIYEKAAVRSRVELTRMALGNPPPAP